MEGQYRPKHVAVRAYNIIVIVLKLIVFIGLNRND